MALLILLSFSNFLVGAYNENHINLGIQISGHIIPYIGISIQQGVREIGLNLGMALPHNLLGSTLFDAGYQGEIYFRYDFINTDFYPKFHIKTLTAPASSEEDEFLVLIGTGLQYLYSPSRNRFGGGIELNFGLPISALDRFAGPIPYLSLESSFDFG